MRVLYCCDALLHIHFHQFQGKYLVSYVLRCVGCCRGTQFSQIRINLLKLELQGQSLDPAVKCILHPFGGWFVSLVCGVLLFLNRDSPESCVGWQMIGEKLELRRKRFWWKSLWGISVWYVRIKLEITMSDSILVLRMERMKKERRGWPRRAIYPPGQKRGRNLSAHQSAGGIRAVVSLYK